MALQHYDNLFRRYKGRVIVLKTLTGGTYEGSVSEITNDFVELLEAKDGETLRVFVFFQAIESVQVSSAPAS
jgi:hypothetical protein